MPKGIFLPLDVDFASNKDVVRLLRYGRDVPALRDFLVQCWCHCKRHQSDGHVPSEVMGLMVYPEPPKVAERRAACLVEVGIAVRTDDGLYFPDYLRHNKSRVQIAEESERKKAAGRKGGERSGQVRRGEANPKQGGSTRANTETETYTEPQPEPSSSSLGGERQVTLHAVPATEPSQDEERCTRHPNGNAADEACRGCERVEARKARRATGEAERRRIAAETAARNCTRCDGTWEVDDDRAPTRRRCNHTRRTA
jgi:hypothetical protein